MNKRKIENLIGIPFLLTFHINTREFCHFFYDEVVTKRNAHVIILQILVSFLSDKNMRQVHSFA